MTKSNEQPAYEPEDAGRRAVYLRVSAAYDNAGSDVDAQKREIERFAEEQGGDLAESSADEGLSGERPERPVFQQLLADARSGDKDLDQVTVYVVEHVSRSVREWDSFRDRLTEAGDDPDPA